MNNLFPATYSTLSPAALAVFLEEKYGLDIADCKMILRGVGDTYLLSARGNPAGAWDGRLILRVYRPDQRSLSQIKAETDLLLALKEKAIPVSWPIADLSGAVILAVEAIEGTRHMVLFSYAPGQSFQKLNEKQLYDLGYQMARMHVASGSIALADKRWTFDLETTLFKPLENLRGIFGQDPEGYAWLQAAVKFAGEKLVELDLATLPSGVCHFDFLPKNFHFDGGAVTLFDFDFFGYGAFANDIMTFWQHLSLDLYFGRISQEELEGGYSHFLKGYQDIRPVNSRELEAVPYLSLGFWLFYMNFHTTHDQFLPFIQPDHLKLRINLIRRLMEKSWDQSFLVAG